MQFCVDLSNSNHLNSDHWSTPPGSTHEVITVEAINDCCWGNCLIAWQWLPQTVIISTAIVNQPPPGSTHEAITVEAINDHCWGDCLITWQRSLQTVIISTAIIDWPPQDQHMRQSLLRQLPHCLTAIASNSNCLNSDCQLTPPGSTHETTAVEVIDNHFWGDHLIAWQQSPQTVIVSTAIINWLPLSPGSTHEVINCWGDHLITWQQSPQTAITSTAIVNWLHPQDQHMRQSLLRRSPQTAIVSTAIVDRPPPYISNL